MSRKHKNTALRNHHSNEKVENVVTEWSNFVQNLKICFYSTYCIKYFQLRSQAITRSLFLFFSFSLHFFSLLFASFLFFLEQLLILDLADTTKFPQSAIGLCEYSYYLVNPTVGDNFYFTYKCVQEWRDSTVTLEPWQIKPPLWTKFIKFVICYEPGTAVENGDSLTNRVLSLPQESHSLGRRNSRV